MGVQETKITWSKGKRPRRRLQGHRSRRLQDEGTRQSSSSGIPPPVDGKQLAPTGAESLGAPKPLQLRPH